jgi:hypothetical protein
MNVCLQHLERLAERLCTGYNEIGHSERSPYGYYIHDPQETRSLPELLPKYFKPPLTLCLVDLLELSIESLEGQEQRHQELLAKDLSGQAQALEELWVRRTKKKIEALSASVTENERPVAVISNTAALHPISHPSSFLASWDRYGPCLHPNTGKSIPLILLIPGFHHASSGRMYHFLDRQQKALTLYLGENIW